MKAPAGLPAATHNITFSALSYLSTPTLKSRRLKSLCASIKPPPPEFDFRSPEILGLSTSTVANIYPDLADLAERGSLVRIVKKQFGPVPEWRSEFVEPEEIWLLGTTHIFGDSSLDVERVVRTLKPDNVVVELCRSRAGIMYTCDEDMMSQRLKGSMFSLSGTEFFGAIGRSINLGDPFPKTEINISHSIRVLKSFSLTGGQTALALRLLLAVMSSRISSDVNRPFGDEFRAARRVAEEVGAQIVLGDRPIEITLDRAWNSLSWTEKINLVVSAIRGIVWSPEKSKNELKDSGMDVKPSQLYDQLSVSYPALLQPLIHERDTYIAWSLKRSKAVKNSKRVVGVIGKGHLNGVVYALISDQGNLRFRDLAGNAPKPWVRRLLNGLLRDTVVGILVWALYQQITSMSF